jgi:hypothetical protein
MNPRPDGTDCAHVGVAAGPPWIATRTASGRPAGPVCEHCGVAWPGHELPVPYGIKERSPGYGALPSFDQQPFQQESPR